MKKKKKWLNSILSWDYMNDEDKIANAVILAIIVIIAIAIAIIAA